MAAELDNEAAWREADGPGISRAVGANKLGRLDAGECLRSAGGIAGVAGDAFAELSGAKKAGDLALEAAVAGELEAAAAGEETPRVDAGVSVGDPRTSAAGEREEPAEVEKVLREVAAVGAEDNEGGRLEDEETVDTEAPAPTESTARLLSGGVAMTVSSTTITPLTSAPYCSSRRRDIGLIWQPRKSV